MKRMVVLGILVALAGAPVVRAQYPWKDTDRWRSVGNGSPSTRESGRFRTLCGEVPTR